MATCLYKLYQEFAKMEVPPGYKVVFEFDDKERIILRVRHMDSDLVYTWAISPKELEYYKLDFVKQHIHSMIEEIQTRIKEEGEC